MCSLFKSPDIKPTPVSTVTKADNTSAEDTAATALEQQKKRQGFQSTIATSGAGVTGPANVAKTQLGG